jgi:hypothetical protein
MNCWRVYSSGLSIFFDSEAGSVGFNIPSMKFLFCFCVKGIGPFFLSYVSHKLRLLSHMAN